MSEKKEASLAVKVISYGLAGIIGLWFMGAFKSGGKSQTSDTFYDTKALTMCQIFIQNVSKNPKVAEIPYTRNQAGVTSSDFIFIWDRSDPVMLQNGFGAMIANTGTCKVNKKTKAITSLVLNGEKIL